VLWPAALLIGFTAALFFLAATAHGINDYKGRPLGSDFSNVYAAGRYVLQGEPTAPFDPARQHAEQQAIFGKTTPFISWQYPPFFLPAAGLLALLPYLPALLVWQLATFALYLGALALLLRASFPLIETQHKAWILLAVVFPAVFVNIIHGQNGFLTAALLAGGIGALDRRPVLAGVLFGLLAYKPQFLPLVPLALIAAARWRALLAMVVTAAVLAAAATVAYGSDLWHAFFASAQFARTGILEQGQVGFYKMQSVFAWARLWGSSIPLAYVLQGIASTAAAISLVIIWRKPVTFADRGAALCLASLLATPYCLDYDFMALAPAIALLGAQGMARGFRPYEKSILVLLWAVPIVTRGAAAVLLLPAGAIVMLLAGIFLVRNAMRTIGAKCSVLPSFSAAEPEARELYAARTSK